MIITVHALGRYVSPDRVFTYGISTLSDFDIHYAREKGVKIKLVAQCVKLDEEKFTMFVMPEFVAPGKYIYSVDDEYNGVVIRGECYDRQFMFGKGAGSLPTASSILSDVMARHHDYRYEYKKAGHAGLPEYTDDVELRVYLRHPEAALPADLQFLRVTESYVSDRGCYTVGDIKLSTLRACRSRAERDDIFLCNFPRFYLELD